MKNRKIRLSPSKNRFPQSVTPVVRRMCLMGILFVLLGLAPFLRAGDPAGVIKEKEKMETIKENASASVDRRSNAPSPGGIKTATFALG